jgi:hypothetical protein
MFYPLRETYPAGEHPTATKVIPLKTFPRLNTRPDTMPGALRYRLCPSLLEFQGHHTNQACAGKNLILKKELHIPDDC